MDSTAAEQHTVEQHTALRRPMALLPKDRIGIIAPASPVDPERLRAGLQELERRGYEVVVGRHLFSRRSLFAGSDEERLADLRAMLEDPTVKAIFCARGGYGSQRLISGLRPVLDQIEPKIVVGYSDITALHSMFQRAGWITWHGPMPGDWVRMADGGFSVHALFALLRGEPMPHIPLPPGVKPRMLCPGRTRGRLVGGNLSLIAALLGTEHEIDTRGAILLLEEIGEAPYRVDRMLSSLRLAGKLDGLRGVILGDFTDCAPPPGGPQVYVEEVLQEHFGGLDVPVVMGFPSGHGRVNVPLPLGLEVELDADAGLVRLPIPPVVTVADRE